MRRPRVAIADRQSALVLDREALRRVARRVLSAERCPLSLSLAFVGSAEMARVNETWLGHAGPTDVISFPLHEEGDEDGVLGELVICTDRAAEEATARGIEASEEVARYVVHGALHLLGYDDRLPADRRRMWARQEALLTALRERRPGKRRGAGVMAPGASAHQRGVPSTWGTLRGGPRALRGPAHISRPS